MKHCVIIDGHSHIGRDKFNNRKEVLIEDYANFCSSIGISAGLVMPMPCPLVSNGHNTMNNSEAVVYWEYNTNKGMVVDKSENGRVKQRNLINPYKEVNEHYRSIVENTCVPHFKAFFVPLVHPRLDTPDYLNELIVKSRPVAVKIHGIGSFSSPKDINDAFINVIKSYDMPVIVHTDYNNGSGRYSDYGLTKAVELSSPMRWCDFFDRNQIKGTLNHGAVLDLSTIEKVNKSKYVRIALGPDMRLGGDFSRLAITKDIYTKLGYLGVLKEYLCPTKIIFDVDYDFNYIEEGGFDVNSPKRVSGVWTSEECELIFYRNAIAQYKLSNYFCGEEEC